jgi:hypothetical protein
MVKEVYFFTGMGYTAYPQDIVANYGYTNLMFPNEHFNIVWGREGPMPTRQPCAALT